MAVEAGDEGEGFAAGFEEAFLTADTDFLEGFEAVGDEGGAEDEEAFDAFLGQADEFEVGVGLEPGIAAQSGLEGDRVPADAGALGESGGGAQALGAVTGGVGGGRGLAAVRGFQAMAAGGIAFAEVAFGDAVEAEEHVVVGLVQVGLGAGDEGFEVGGVFEVGRDHVEVGGQALSPMVIAHVFDGGLVAGHGVVGEEGEEEDVGDLLALEAGEGVGDGGQPIAHGQFDGELESGGEVVADLSAGHHQRGAFGGPDGVIGFGGLFGSKGKDQSVDQEGAGEPGEVDDAAVHEEFSEVATDIGDGG